ncbi:MAG TPA: hypothetical protein VGG10_11830 [Rhizomicrobium sp.]|jgi:hypothetical protein
MRISISLLAGAAILLIAGSAEAAKYDAAQQFSAASNVGSMQWTYRYNTTGTRNGVYTLLPDMTSDTRWTTTTNGKKKHITVPFWDGGDFPSLSGNPTTLKRTANFGFGKVNWPGDTIYMHPAATGDVVLSFIAPKSGTIVINYAFSDIDPYGGNGVHWYIDKNAGTQGDLASGTLSAPANPATGPVQMTVNVTKHDRINFIIDANGDNSFDSTTIKAIIAYQ